MKTLDLNQMCGKSGKEKFDTVKSGAWNVVYIRNVHMLCRWVKAKRFQYHPTEGGNVKSDWEKCIQAIDTKNRSIKRKQA